MKDRRSPNTPFRQDRSQHNEPYSYLVTLFKKLPLAHTVDDYESLLPWSIELGAL